MENQYEFYELEAQWAALACIMVYTLGEKLDGRASVRVEETVAEEWIPEADMDVDFYAKEFSSWYRSISMDIKDMDEEQFNQFMREAIAGFSFADEDGYYRYLEDMLIGLGTPTDELDEAFETSEEFYNKFQFENPDMVTKPNNAQDKLKNLLAVGKALGINPDIVLDLCYSL